MEEKFKENFTILKKKKQLLIFTDEKYEEYVQLIQLCTGPDKPKKMSPKQVVILRRFALRVENSDTILYLNGWVFKLFK